MYLHSKRKKKRIFTGEETIQKRKKVLVDFINKLKQCVEEKKEKKKITQDY